MGLKTKQPRTVFLPILWCTFRAMLTKRNADALLALEERVAMGDFNKGGVWGKRAVVCKEKSITEVNCKGQESLKPESFLSPS